MAFLFFELQAFVQENINWWLAIYDELLGLFHEDTPFFT